ncbi:MAG: Smr/MutS family protein [Zavarzinia sp.]|nr:Smr/MutS family protein [Zavarzinia sp.]
MWARVAATVEPLHGRRKPSLADKAEPAPKQAQPKAVTPPKALAPAPKPERPAPAPPGERHGLDTTWERKLARGGAAPDFTLDLHGASLDQAHARLDHGLTQAKALGARVVLLIAGKPRGAAAADRGERRGAIRAKVLDWLAAGPHGSDIAAIRPAHRRHGGEGALYLVLRRRR